MFPCADFTTNVSPVRAMIMPLTLESAAPRGDADTTKSNATSPIYFVFWYILPLLFCTTAGRLRAC